ncbi:DUF4153 domain-containing protein [Dyadobacter sp. CY312]|uniref:DUF4153 domain-containing protein n=1 Tax=Dyadobacter sp. CY312 TaxID=2907303 RepID=UPI001F2661FA|nr:DUF4153 domain-containing protein [Dyadobacter sp. CY312]MCE7042174.1 DUF4153 domain-containing protein [Dyadobacter sp. CY312]
MIKFPSFNTLANSSLDTISRYKLVTLLALTKVVLFIWYIETPYKNEILRNDLTRLLYISFLSVPLAIAITISAKRHSWKNTLVAGIWVLTGVVLALYYFSIKQAPDQTDYYRFMIFFAGVHLLASYAPFIRSNELNGFWQFNKMLFLQFLNATLYSITLYVGLLIAIQTIKFLFNVKFSFEIEADLAVFIFALFHTIFFLSKIPTQLADLEQEVVYPPGLKIFTQYVLLPLEVVYLVILYAYVGKILFQWTLPDGGVAYLTLAFSIAGILALLLLYPLRDNPGERWIKMYSHRFYLALLPLIVLLGIGIFRRINDYGVTENRYLVAVLTFWLAGTTIYFLFVKKNDIRVIPVSLSIICVLVCIGPWNIFSIAQSSQLNQFQHLLTTHKLLTKDNKIGLSAEIPQKDYDQLFSIINFFQQRDSNVLAKFFPSFPIDKKDVNRISIHHGRMRDHLNKFVSSDKISKEDYFTQFSVAGSSNTEIINIDKFKYLFFFSTWEEKKFNNNRLMLISSDFGATLTLFHKGKKIAFWDIAKKEKELRKSLRTNYEDIPQKLMILEYDDENFKAKLILTSISKNSTSYNYQGMIVHN